MDRATVYTQEQGRSTDFLFAQRATMIGLGKLAQAALGSGTVVRGLPVAPNSPAALNVVVGIGEIYSLTAVDATQWGALPADSTDFIVKQGLNMAAQTISTPAPTTGGFSVNYLIEAQYQDQDNVPVVLPYFNSANPSQPLTGQNNSGAAQPTERQGVCVIQAKAGVPAATGTQTTPSVDSGWTALAVVTVANGQSTVTAGNITIPAGVPQITSLVQMMQTESTNYALDTSTTPNQITIALTPPITAYTDGMQLNFRAANNSSGAVNINAGPGNIALSGAAGALQSGEIVAGGYYSAVYQSNTGTAVLVGQGAGAEQVNPATQSKHAMQLGQATGRLLRTSYFYRDGSTGNQMISVDGAAGTTTGASTFTSLAATNKIRARVIGAGGGGGGTAATGSTQYAIGAGGGSGGYAEGIFTGGFSGGLSVTIGVKGAGGAAGSNNGSTGGSSSLGALLSATGGSGGAGGTVQTGVIVGIGGNPGNGSNGIGTITNLNQIGQQGGIAVGVNTGDFVSGSGGGTTFGGGGAGWGSAASVGNIATSFGSGGGGAAATPSIAALAGGQGAPGVVIVEEFS